MDGSAHLHPPRAPAKRGDRGSVRRGAAAPRSVPREHACASSASPGATPQGRQRGGHLPRRAALHARPRPRTGHARVGAVPRRAVPLAAPFHRWKQNEPRVLPLLGTASGHRGQRDCRRLCERDCQQPCRRPRRRATLLPDSGQARGQRLRVEARVRHVLRGNRRRRKRARRTPVPFEHSRRAPHRVHCGRHRHHSVPVARTCRGRGHRGVSADHRVLKPHLLRRAFPRRAGAFGRALKRTRAHRSHPHARGEGGLPLGPRERRHAVGGLRPCGLVLLHLRPERYGERARSGSARGGGSPAARAPGNLHDRRTRKRGAAHPPAHRARQARRAHHAVPRRRKPACCGRTGRHRVRCPVS